MDNRIKLKGIFTITHKDKNGKVKSTEQFENLVTNEGFDYILDSSLHGVTAISSWYFAPFTSDTTPGLTDTYASPSYTEASAANIDEATRQEWAEGASSSQSVTNSTAATITASSGQSFTVYGCGIVGGGSAASTIADTAGGGTLLASAAFTTSKALTAAETLDMTYTIQKA